MKARKKERGSSNFTYLSVVNGEFRHKVPAETPDAIERVNKLGDTVHELVYNELSGVRLKTIEVRESDYGKQAAIMLMDSETREKYFVINLPLSSPYLISFISRVKEIDCEKDITLEIFDIENEYKDENGETKKARTKTITVKQDDKLLPKSWDAKTNPVPKPEPIIKKGKIVEKNGYKQFDTTDREDFVEQYITETNIGLLNFWKAHDMKNLSTKDVDSVDINDVVESDHDLS